jgi:hypothetical protein
VVVVVVVVARMEVIGVKTWGVDRGVLGRPRLGGVWLVGGAVMMRN